MNDPLEPTSKGHGALCGCVDCEERHRDDRRWGDALRMGPGAAFMRRAKARAERETHQDVADYIANRRRMGA